MNLDDEDVNALRALARARSEGTATDGEILPEHMLQRRHEWAVIADQARHSATADASPKGKPLSYRLLRVSIAASALIGAGLVGHMTAVVWRKPNDPDGVVPRPFDHANGTSQPATMTKIWRDVFVPSAEAKENVEGLRNAGGGQIKGYIDKMRAEGRKDGEVLDELWLKFGPGVRD